MLCGSDLEAYHGIHPKVTYPQVLGHDLCADPIQRVVPGKGAEVGPGAVPPQDPQLVEPCQAGAGTLDAREVELVKLLGGEDPMLGKIDADELIPVRERCRNPLDLGADAARARTRGVASPTR